MKALPSLALVVAASFALAACPPTAANPRSLPGAWNEAQARVVALAVAKSWQFPADPDIQKDRQASVYAVLPFDQVGVPGWLVLVAVVPASFTCHACAPVTGGVLFTRKGEVWQASFDQAHVLRLGANGRPPGARSESLGPNQPAAAFEMEAMAQGYQGRMLTLVSLWQGKLTEVLSLQTQADNGAAGLPEAETFHWQAHVEVLPVSNAGYFDLRLTYSGTKPSVEGNKLSPYTGSTVYRFRDGSYSPLT